MANPKKGNSLFWGVVLILFGVLILLHQFNVHIWHAIWQLWRFWPVILIIWGANKLWLGLKEKNAQESSPAADKTHEI
jgi:hypothetical protein